MGDQSNLGDIKNTASQLMGRFTSQLPEWTGILNQDVDLVVLYERMGGLFFFFFFFFFFFVLFCFVLFCFVLFVFFFFFCFVVFCLSDGEVYFSIT